MATAQLILLTLLLAFSFTLQRLAVEAHEEVEHQLVITSKGVRTLLATIDCNSACSGRCQLSSRPNYCMRACKTCCARCSCVPPGTSGNYDQCPCYASLTTRGGKRKCP